MNREQKRKDAKKNKKINVSDVNTVSSNELYRLLKICLIVVILFAILYLIVGIFVTKEIELFKDKEEENSESVTEKSNAILAKSIFNQKEDEYYVYFYDFKNENTNIATSIVNVQTNSTVYYVDTADILNKNYVTTEGSNKNATNLDDLKVVKDTIIKISGDTIVEYYEGESEITSNLY